MKILNIEGLRNLKTALDNVVNHLMERDDGCRDMALYNLGRIIEKIECIIVREEEKDATSEG